MRYWREVLLVVLVTLPWLSLLVLGIAWLWQGGYVWIWALAAGSIGLLSWPLWYSVKRRSKGDRSAGRSGGAIARLECRRAGRMDARPFDRG
jgi:hypothetical protein